jgi:pilus assembly protein CpaF
VRFSFAPKAAVLRCRRRCICLVGPERISSLKSSRFFDRNASVKPPLIIALLFLVPMAVMARGPPFDTGFNSMQVLFTGTIAKVASLVAIVIGGYGFAHGEHGGKRDGIIRREETISFDPGNLPTGLEVIANQLGKKLDEDNPVLNAQFPDGSRLAAVIPPVVRPAPALTIRKFTSRCFTIEDLIARGTLTRRLADFLAEQIRSGKTLLISGGTGTGKTTLLRILADFIPEQDRIVVIEDTSELHIQKPNIPAVECQTDTFNASISFDDLLKSALRWRPNRIILGEVRGIEAQTLLDSFNTGHAASLATIHANLAEKALRRFANLVMRNHAQTTFSDTEAEIGGAVDLVVHVERQPGRRFIREVLALRGYDRDAKRFLIEPVFEGQYASA